MVGRDTASFYLITHHSTHNYNTRFLSITLYPRHHTRFSSIPHSLILSILARMRSFIVASALAGLAFASPVPQDIDFELAYALPDPSYATSLLDQGTVTATTVTYDTSSILETAMPQITSSVPITATTVDVATYTGDANAKKVKRTACATQPLGAGPTPATDSAAAFLADEDFSSIANAAPVPSGYTQMFQNLQASNKYVDMMH